ncbi:DedA family protein [Shinella yambaruensis]|uniref:Membrane protein n=1 Tax=Shinella yambaruensis TaxID=415996 RepID=A0ABQ5ZFW8_9HYPH|nr:MULTISPECIES: YqaA family protein [Shinella]MCJ8026722.1 DedA family protein [Shinella yambaruensis]MCU7982930.1 DedA family protein [Shinella yambaruensis]MCW5708388.1 DedA family protein [Shinella sp.]GLR51563.1 membrane protein [Shinella yambaruensis]
MSTLAAYGGLFLAALVAATILPAQSEAVLGGLLATGTYSPVLLILVAGTGNVLGSVVNWLLGRGVERFRGSRWFPVSDGNLDRAGRWYRRYGWWSLLFSWMPVIGDPLTVAAGIMREPFLRFLVVVSIAKFGRYIVLAALVLHWL